MTETPAFDGPRLIRAEEYRASRRLSQICFSDETPPEPADEEPAQDELEAGEKPGRQAGETYLIAAEGKPVSQISIFWSPLVVYDCHVRAGFIGGVCTHPDYRGHGLASQLMEHCAHRLVQEGARLMIVSGGRGLYLRSGCTPMGRFAGFRLRPEQAVGPVAGLHLRFARPEDGAACSRFYQAEPARFARSPERFAARFGPHGYGFRAEEWLVEMDGEPAAYLLLNVPWDAIGDPDRRVRCIYEYAGSRVALAWALRSAVARLELTELEAPIPWQDADLIHLLTECQTCQDWVGLPDHTIRILDFPGLMSDLRAYTAARLDARARRGLRFEQSGPLLGTAGGDRYAIVRGRDRLELDGAQMSALVMGGPEPLAVIPTGGALAEICAALFPLPAFFTGLDYH